METAEPPELDLWWQQRLDLSREVARPPELTRYEATLGGRLTTTNVTGSGTWEVHGD